MRKAVSESLRGSAFWWAAGRPSKCSEHGDAAVPRRPGCPGAALAGRLGGLQWRGGAANSLQKILVLHITKQLCLHFLIGLPTKIQNSRHKKVFSLVIFLPNKHWCLDIVVEMGFENISCSEERRQFYFLHPLRYDVISGRGQLVDLMGGGEVTGTLSLAGRGANLGSFLGSGLRAFPFASSDE